MFAAWTVCSLHTVCTVSTASGLPAEIHYKFIYSLSRRSAHSCTLCCVWETVHSCAESCTMVQLGRRLADALTHNRHHSRVAAHQNTHGPRCTSAKRVKRHHTTALQLQHKSHLITIHEIDRSRGLAALAVPGALPHAGLAPPTLGGTTHPAPPACDQFEHQPLDEPRAATDAREPRSCLA